MVVVMVVIVVVVPPEGPSQRLPSHRNVQGRRVARAATAASALAHLCVQHLSKWTPERMAAARKTNQIAAAYA